MTVSTTSTPAATTRHVLFITDAWLPQVNGVVRTISNVKEGLESCRFCGDSGVNIDDDEAEGSKIPPSSNRWNYSASSESIASSATDLSSSSSSSSSSLSSSFSTTNNEESLHNHYCKVCKNILPYKIHVLEPGCFSLTLPLPWYPEIKLALDVWRVPQMIERIQPDAIHIFTEGPLGLAARIYLQQKSPHIPFTTSYHTRFPEYVESYSGTSSIKAYQYISWFHSLAKSTLVPTPSVLYELKDLFASPSIANSPWIVRPSKQQQQQAQDSAPSLALWTRGVDRRQFNASLRECAEIELPHLAGLARPILLCVSRLAQEKNVETFCKIPSMVGSKILVGDGPQFQTLKHTFKDSGIVFTGALHGRNLALHYALADVFVFPSLLDTFGNVMIEAMACGTPVAAFHVTGPKDVVDQGKTGILAPFDNNNNIQSGMGGDLDGLIEAIAQCQTIPRKIVLEASEKWSVASCVGIFERNLVFTRYWKLNPNHHCTKGRPTLIRDCLLGLEFSMEFASTLLYMCWTIFSSYAGKKLMGTSN